MSGEFREVSRTHFVWQALEEFTDDGEHPISRALADLYRAVAPIERACAWHEARDSGAGRPVIELLAHSNAIVSAVNKLSSLAREYEGLITAIEDAKRR